MFALLNQLGKHQDTEFRQELVWQFSNERTTSSRDLTHTECADLIRHLERQVGKRRSVAKFTRSADHAAGDRQRKRILSMFHEMVWKTPEGELDWDRINRWMRKYSYLHKELDAYAYKELPKLVTQVNGLLTSYYRTGNA